MPRPTGSSDIGGPIRNNLHYALRLTGNKEEAKDLVQEGLRVYYQKVARFGPASVRNPGGLIHSVVRRRWIDRLRYRKRHQTVSLQEHIPGTSCSLEDLLPDNGLPDPRSLLEEREVRDAIGEAVRSLTDQQRTAYTLLRFDHRSYREIATMLDVSVSAVRSRIYHARKAILKNLRDRGLAGYALAEEECHEKPGRRSFREGR